MTRAVIVNADDFGQSAGINRGIIEAHERGIVTSASLMVRWPESEGAARYARAHPRLSVGLHVDLCEWACRNGEWRAVYERVDGQDPVAVDAEVRAQLAAFCRLLGRNPTHLDSHQHVHRADPAHSILVALARELAIPLRHYSNIPYVGAFYGQTSDGESLLHAISAAALIDLLGRLPEGTSELGCHPGYADDVNSMYCGERVQELHTLCEEEVRRALTVHRINLVPFSLS